MTTKYTSYLEKVKFEGFIKLFLNISCGQIFADYLSFYFSLGCIFADLAKLYELRENEFPRKLISWRQLFCLNQWVWWNLILNTSQRKKILLFSKNFCSLLNFWHSSCWSTLFFLMCGITKKILCFLYLLQLVLDLVSLSLFQDLFICHN